ncbi:ester cyclase [Chitinophaga pinensis]|uniref:Ester cyclase n=1 Tax=Chitinophaga pinensis (strain ATCC 43595 / DSM 2588 / LMG 13176 / NBRC 15968 / NCIMB 11800 / UQM 2034) TaxID=485918 RepID=A0A979G7D4_CHIPD|nr:ester cyclase [Chitinophaga pinensis]ACU62071.1 protein of unknown function DUF1486 [Chitinophaga pinensis DSM 2588]
MDNLTEIYLNYLGCLNDKDWRQLADFVSADVIHNGRRLGIDGYREMLIGNYRDIPDLRFEPELLVVQDTYVACRLSFRCTPTGEFLGLPVNGKKIRFAENVFYEFQEGKITEVWSVVDKAAIEKQL